MTIKSKTILILSIAGYLLGLWLGITTDLKNLGNDIPFWQAFIIFGTANAIYILGVKVGEIKK